MYYKNQIIYDDYIPYDYAIFADKTHAEKNGFTVVPLFGQTFIELYLYFVCDFILSIIEGVYSLTDGKYPGYQCL